MSFSLNHQVVSSFHRSLTARDYTSLRSLLAEHVTFDFPALLPVNGRAQTILLLKKIRSEFSILQFEITNVISENDYCACEWRNNGTTREGTPFANRGVTIFRIDAGQIEKISDYFKAFNR